MLQWFLDNREDITFWIAVAGFFISVWSIARQLWRERKNLSVKIEIQNELNCFPRENTNSILCIFILFENHSMNPISITKVELYTPNQTVIAQLNPHFIGHLFRRLCDTETPFYERFIESAKFPIELSALGAAEEFLYFGPTEDTSWKQIDKLIIYTNRGKVTVRSKAQFRGLREQIEKSYRPLVQNCPESESYPASEVLQK